MPLRKDDFEEGDLLQMEQQGTDMESKTHAQSLVK